MVADISSSRDSIPFTVRGSRRAIERFLEAPPYEPCLLLVASEIETLNAAQSYLKEYYDWTTLSIGGALTTELMTVVPTKRPRRVRSILQTAVREGGTGPLLCTDIELLFHPDLKQDPLRLFRDASRLAPLIVLWPGTVENDTLAYAVEGHAHYRTWPASNLCNYCIIRL